MKTLNELYKELKLNANSFIGIYEGKGKPIYPDFADELLETHGNKLVKDYKNTKDGAGNPVLVVLFEEEK